MTNTFTPSAVTRRGFLATSLGAAATVGLAACGGKSPNVPGSNPAPSGGGGAQVTTGRRWR